jgi:uncharacterized protein YneF (UPF0154 family)
MGHHPPVGSETVPAISTGISPLSLFLIFVGVVVGIYIIYKLIQKYK